MRTGTYVSLLLHLHFIGPPNWELLGRGLVFYLQIIAPPAITCQAVQLPQVTLAERCLVGVREKVNNHVRMAEWSKAPNFLLYITS